MDTPQKPKRSRAMMDAQKRYYLKNRTAQLEKMKERARLRSAEQRELAMNDEKVLLERRAMMLDKYHTYMKNDKERRIKAWLDDPDISPAFKTFLIENVVPVKESIPAVL